MKRKIIDSSEKERSLGALLEDMDDKFQVILEATALIPKMQADLNRVLTWEENIKMIPIIPT